jgi:hypothetical protein
MQVTVSFFEIYGGRCQDLLNNRNRLIVREDGQGDVCVADLTEIPVDTKVSLEVRECIVVFCARSYGCYFSVMFFFVAIYFVCP